MVKKRFISANQYNQNVWYWPVRAKSESPKENVIAIISTFVTTAIPFSRFEFIFILTLILLYSIKVLDVYFLILIALISGMAWLGIGLLSNFHIIYQEMYYSYLWKAIGNNATVYYSIWFIRSTFFASIFSLFWIFYNRRSVNPDKCHIKVVNRQRHERLRLMRKWQREQDLKEVL